MGNLCCPQEDVQEERKPLITEEEGAVIHNEAPLSAPQPPLEMQTVQKTVEDPVPVQNTGGKPEWRKSAMSDLASEFRQKRLSAAVSPLIVEEEPPQKVEEPPRIMEEPVPTPQPPAPQEVVPETRVEQPPQEQPPQQAPPQKKEWRMSAMQDIASEFQKKRASQIPKDQPEQQKDEPQQQQAETQPAKQDPLEPIPEKPSIIEKPRVIEEPKKEEEPTPQKSEEPSQKSSSLFDSFVKEFTERTGGLGGTTSAPAIQPSAAPRLSSMTRNRVSFAARRSNRPKSVMRRVPERVKTPIRQEISPLSVGEAKVSAPIEKVEERSPSPPSIEEEKPSIPPTKDSSSIPVDEVSQGIEKEEVVTKENGKIGGEIDKVESIPQNGEKKEESIEEQSENPTKTPVGARGFALPGFDPSATKKGLRKSVRQTTTPPSQEGATQVDFRNILKKTGKNLD
eukprot:CAMPEP_0201478926 /NCGR_PEP_ID=MMETSP0151_2-20130828/3682_1 /ASSEMBLY_ACC=CAM_ASM_000257 /TAXON_ID=200890 /ORGANISM="Paramoeba atlantica, Strain 621/1 / CCAP 1560/9" /LENGTH=451 /DNA_ID=CAMNT_0047860199 /DNA_START=58 /DNA_END=1413 /DNA_ORIENTATION=-